MPKAKDDKKKEDTSKKADPKAKGEAGEEDKCQRSTVLTVVLEKTLESPLDCKEIQPVHPKGVGVFLACHGYH